MEDSGEDLEALTRALVETIKQLAQRPLACEKQIAIARCGGKAAVVGAGTFDCPRKKSFLGNYQTRHRG